MFVTPSLYNLMYNLLHFFLMLFVPPRLVPQRSAPPAMCLREWLEPYSYWRARNQARPPVPVLSFSQRNSSAQLRHKPQNTFLFRQDEESSFKPGCISIPSLWAKTLLTPCPWICKSLSHLALPSMLKLCSLCSGRGVLVGWPGSPAAQAEAAATAGWGASFRSTRPQNVLQKVEECASFILFF